MIDRVESAMTDHRARLMLATLGFLRLVAWPRRRAHRAEDRGGPAMKVVLLALLFAGLGGRAIASPPLKTARLVSSSPPILIHTGMAMTPVVEPA